MDRVGYQRVLCVAVRAGLMRLALAVLSVAGCGCVVSVASAHALVGGFGSEGEGAGQFAQPAGVAVNQETGDVYLVDRDNNRVEKWSAEGGFALAWGWGVADGMTAALQSCEAVCFAGLPGAGAGQFGGSPAGVAVDNSLGLSHGDVYVVDRANSRVEKFSPSGEFLLMFGSSGSGPGEFEALADNSIAVDSAGSVYVGDRERVQKFSAAGVVEGEIALPGVGIIDSVAVDSSKDLYVLADGLVGVHKYDGAGVELGKPRDTAVVPVFTRIAVGPSDELFVYADDQRHVQEFDPSGVQVSAFVEEGFSGGIAYGDKVKALYVLHQGVVSVVVPPPPGPVVLEGSERVDGVLPTSAVAHAVVNPEGPAVTSYRFEYGTTAAYGLSTPSTELTGGAFEDQPVGATLTGLSPSTVYHFRVVATNVALETTVGPDQTFSSAPPVSIESESVSQVSGSGARLETVLNAHGLPSEYHFEYGLSTAYGQTVPVPDGEAGSSSSGVGFSALVEGLQPGASYHYRVVAHNALGVEQGPDQVFITQSAPPAALADGRGWEMVSPPNKHAVALEGISEEGVVIQASESGGGLAYVAKAPIGSETAGNRSIADTQLLATRGSGGWQTQDIATAHEEVTGLIVGHLSEYQLFSGDLSVGLVEPFGATPLAPALMGAHGERTPYRRESNGQYTPLVTAANTPSGTKFGGEETKPSVFVGGVEFVSMTSDGSHIVLTSPVPLTAGIPGGQELYEWSAGTLQLVSVLPNGTPVREEGLGASLGNQGLQVRNAVSNDGSRLVFETAPIEGGVRHLFLRDVVRGDSVQLDVPALGLKASSQSPVFQAASVDGSRVFFTDAARLTFGSTAKEGEPDLYMCDVSVVAGRLSCALRDLTVDGSPGEAANVQGDIIGVGDQGRFVYFAANGALAAGAVHGDCSPGPPPAEASAAASCNLYVRDTLSETTRLVGVVSNRDEVDWRAGAAGTDLGEMTAGVSGSGQFLAFMSTRSLTGYDNRDVRSGERDAEVFLFDVNAGSLRCVSCDRSGARPVGLLDPVQPPRLLADGPGIWGGQWLAGSVPGWTRVTLGKALYQSRYLSDSGRLFFNSVEGLVPSDANGREDVYEFEPNGVGGCSLTAGCVSLMSSGGSGEESAFLDASVGGNDVFFLSAAKLVPADVDSALDVYDAHVCSVAVPCPSGVVSASPACSTADSCRAAPLAQPDVFGAPSSSTFSGSGNVTATVVKPVVRPLTRAQKLARALRVCAKKPRRKRAACRAAARKRYGPVHSARKHAKKSGRGK